MGIEGFFRFAESCGGIGEMDFQIRTFFNQNKGVAFFQDGEKIEMIEFSWEEIE